MTAMAQRWIEQDAAFQGLFKPNFVLLDFDLNTVITDDHILFAMANGLFEEIDRLWACVAPEIQANR